MDQFWLGFCPSQVTKNDLEKLKCTYRQLSKDAVLARDKYKEAVVKGELLIYSLLIFQIINIRFVVMSDSQQMTVTNQFFFLSQIYEKCLGLKV